MVYKRLYIQIIIRVLLLTITCFFFTYELLRTSHNYTLINIFILIILQVVFLVRYLNKTNKILTNFIDSIKSGDQTGVMRTSFNNDSFKQLNNCLNEINKAIQKVKIENQVQWEYFQKVVEHIGIGIISYDQNGTIDLYNKAAKSIVNLNTLNNLTQLEIHRSELYLKLLSVKPGDSDSVRITNDGNNNEYAISTTKSVFNERVITIASIQNINRPLENKEIESYQKLIRVLTHEIMNSVAPITSLTNTLSKNVKNNTDNSNMDKAMIDKTIRGLEIIEKRSKGLAEFVQKFRDVSIIPTLSIIPVNFNRLIESVLPLFNSAVTDYQISVSLEIDDDFIIDADETQLEQVIINIFKNAVEAVKDQEQKTISVKTITKESGKIIEIHDSGIGISKENLEKVFIPFYTTKENGSGVGLSYVKQVMLAHNGNIKIESNPGNGSTVKLIFS